MRGKKGGVLTRRIGDEATRQKPAHKPLLHRPLFFLFFSFIFVFRFLLPDFMWSGCFWGFGCGALDVGAQLCRQSNWATINFLISAKPKSQERI